MQTDTHSRLRSGLKVPHDCAGRACIDFIGKDSAPANRCTDYVTIITITIYFIHPSGKLKLSFDRTMKNISQ